MCEFHFNTHNENNWSILLKEVKCCTLTVLILPKKRLNLTVWNKSFVITVLVLLLSFETLLDTKCILLKLFLLIFLSFLHDCNFMILNWLLLHWGNTGGQHQLQGGKKINKNITFVLWHTTNYQHGATVQESCTLLDTQSQQGMYKRRQVQLPAVFSQGKHTRLTEYHGIHTDKLIISNFGRLFKFIYHYIIDLFSALCFDLISHYSTNGRITLWKKCTPPSKTSGPRGAFERSRSFRTSLPLQSSSLSHNVNIYIQHACVHGYQK